jgi:predicted methyltransferase
MKRASLVASFAVFLLAACGGGNAADQPVTCPRPPSVATPTPAVQAAPGAVGSSVLTGDALAVLVSAGDRTDDDRKLDAQRHPDQFLAFVGVGPGMRVADLGAGGGYTTELLARAVGPSGKVYAQNDPELIQRFLDKPMTLRLSRPVNQGVVRVDRPFDDPFPPDAQNLDRVTFFIFYHDVVWIGADRDKMNKAVFAALRPGGVYVVVDSSAKAGDGVSVAKTLHRIEESVVKSEVQKAGFTLSGSADFLRSAGDTRDWNSSPKAAGDRRGTEDRFVLKFVKP